MRGVIVRASDGRVLSAVELPAGWSGMSGEWQPPTGTTVLISDMIQPTVDPPTPEQTNERTIEERAEIALAANMAFLMIAGTLTNSQRDVQLRALTRQINGLIRLALSRFEGAD